MTNFFIVGTIYDYTHTDNMPWEYYRVGNDRNVFIKLSTRDNDGVFPSDKIVSKYKFKHLTSLTHDDVQKCIEHARSCQGLRKRISSLDKNLTDTTAKISDIFLSK